MILRLFLLLFTINYSIAQVAMVPLLPLELNSQDAIGALRSKGTIGLKLNADNSVNAITTFFKIKAFGISVSSIGPRETPLAYDQVLDLLQSQDITGLGGIVPDRALTTIVIQKPNKNFANNTLIYNFDVNILKAFGENSPIECLTYDKLKMKLVQIGQNFKVFYLQEISPGIFKESELILIKQKLKFLGDEKKLSQLELISPNQDSIIIKYENCQRVK